MKSILIIGLGRMGRHLARKFTELGNDVLVVDRRAAVVEAAENCYTDARIGDCSNEAVLRALDVTSFDYAFVCIGEDFQSSLVITSLLKKLGATHVIAKAKQDIQAELLKTIGADEVIYPEKDMAQSLAIRYSDANIFDYVELTQEYSIYEISLPQEWQGKTLVELALRQKYAINVIGVKNGTLFSPVPAADYRFVAEDHLLVIGKSADIFSLTKKIK